MTHWLFRLGIDPLHGQSLWYKGVSGVGSHNNKESPAWMAFKKPLNGRVRWPQLDHRVALPGMCAFVVDCVLMKGIPDLFLPLAGHFRTQFLCL